MRARPEPIMNTIYLFGSHADYRGKRGFLPYFLLWPTFNHGISPYFYTSALIPERVRLVNVVVLWLVAISLIISLGYLRYDPPMDGRINT